MLFHDALCGHALQNVRSLYIYVVPLGWKREGAGSALFFSFIEETWFPSTKDLAQSASFCIFDISLCLGRPGLQDRARYCSLTRLSGSSEQKHCKDDSFLMYFKGLSLTMCVCVNDHYFLQWVKGTVTESPPFSLLSRSLSISCHLQQRFIEIHDVKTWVGSFKVFLMSFWDYTYGRSDQHQETECTPSFHSCFLAEYNQKPWGSPVSTSLDL